jgi:uncharacterized protein (TIGR02145 family)
MKATFKTILLIALLISLSCSDDQNLESKAIHIKNKESLRPTPPTIVGQVTIGTQIWTTTNLGVNKYRNGDIIPEVNDPEIWKTLTTGAYCRSVCDNYNTKLYNWYAVNDPRGLAPQGWHIPSVLEVATLSNFLGGLQLAGNKLKGQSSAWYPANPNITNSSGFTGLPLGGMQAEANGSYSCSSFGIWWMATEIESEARCFQLQSYVSYFATNLPRDKREGYTIRLIKN